MKGIVLAGGKGSRLYPLTAAVDKHLLPIYNEPMILKVLRTLINSGITDICLVVSAEVSNNINILGDGSQLGCKLTYICQAEPKGIAHALSLCKDFAKGNKVAVILADNIFQDSFGKEVREFDKLGLGCGCRLFLKELPDYERFGVATVNDNKIINLVEKPLTLQEETRTLRHYAVTGLYFYDEYLFTYIEVQNNEIGYSARGELEITDLNKLYLRDEMVEYSIVGGWWVDAGTFESLYLASKLVRIKENENRV